MALLRHQMGVLGAWSASSLCRHVLWAWRPASPPGSVSCCPGDSEGDRSALRVAALGAPETASRRAWPWLPECAADRASAGSGAIASATRSRPAAHAKRRRRWRRRAALPRLDRACCHADRLFVMLQRGLTRARDPHPAPCPSLTSASLVDRCEDYCRTISIGEIDNTLFDGDVHRKDAQRGRRSQALTVLRFGSSHRPARTSPAT